MRIGILVDNPYRDLPGLTLVAKDLCQKGATCFLIPVNLRESEVWSLAPDFLLLNHFRTIYEDFVRRLLSAGIKVGVLDTEGSIFSPVPTDANQVLEGKDTTESFDEYALSMARDEGLRKQISIYCSWTRRFADFAVDSSWYSSEQIKVCGTPRMDFYSGDFRKAAVQLASYVDEYKKPRVLINSSFTLANPRFHAPEVEAQMMVSKFGYSEEFVTQWMENQKTALKKLVELANTVAEILPELTVVFRPHPFEKEETYEELLSNSNNLHIVKEGTVDGWLLQVVALIHWGSSTAIDASLAGIPAFHAEWIPEHLPIESVSAVSVSCKSIEELLSNLRLVIRGDYKLPEEKSAAIDDVVEQSFYKIDGKAHERVSAAIFEAGERNNERVNLDLCRKYSYVNDNMSFQRKCLGRMRRVLGLPPRWSLLRMRHDAGERQWERSAKFFDVKKVQQILDAVGDSKRVTAGSAEHSADYLLGSKRGRAIRISAGG